jgi:hypothetical protein
LGALRGRGPICAGWSFPWPMRCVTCGRLTRRLDRTLPPPRSLSRNPRRASTLRPCQRAAVFVLAHVARYLNEFPAWMDRLDAAPVKWFDSFWCTRMNAHYPSASQVVHVHSDKFRMEALYPNAAVLTIIGVIFVKYFLI